MRLKITYGSAWLALLALPMLSASANAQMRPDCMMDPTKPGACFIESDEGFNAEIFCGVPSLQNDDLNDGYFIWFGINGQNDFTRVNPDGTNFIHNSDDEVLAAYCSWATAFSGLCTFDSLEVFWGTVSIQANGVASSGIVECPFVLSSAGELTRPSDGKTVKFRPTLHLVPDPVEVCKVQRCSLRKPGNADDDG